MNAPEINLKEEKWIGQEPGLSDGQSLEIFDVKNPGSVVKITIENGSLYIEMTNSAGTDKTTKARPVVLASTAK